MMKKMKWIILTGAAVLIMALCCVLFILRHGSSNYGGVMDGDGMINPVAISTFSYYRGGGMENGHYKLKVPTPCRKLRNGPLTKSPLP